MASLYAKVATTGEYATTSEDRMLARQARVEKELEEVRLNVPEETEEDAAQRQVESDLAKHERLKKADEQKKQREKAKTFSKGLNKGTWKAKAAISILDIKKKKKIKKLHTHIIQTMMMRRDLYRRDSTY